MSSTLGQAQILHQQENRIPHIEPLALLAMSIGFNSLVHPLSDQLVKCPVLWSPSLARAST
jgi:hypothetical protein